MDSFFKNNNLNFTMNEDLTDSISMKINRSKNILSELGDDNLESNSSGILSSTAYRESGIYRKSKYGNEGTPIFSRQHLTNKSFLTSDVTSTNQSTLVESNETQYQTSSTGIYAQFKLDSNKYIDEENNLTNLLNAFSSTCAENVEFLDDKIQMLKLNRHKQDQLNQIITEQDNLDREKQLWKLIYTLYNDELLRQDQDVLNNENAYEDDLVNFIGINEVKLEKRLTKNKPFFRRIKIVIEWLERITIESKNFKQLKQKLSEFNEKCAGWEHTLHQLKHSNSSLNKKERLNTYSAREFVDELDPDAPIRQEKSLHDLDQEDEYKLMEYVYMFIRAGDLNSARDFCYKTGQAWRAATFEGFRLFNDKNYDVNNNKSVLKSNNQLYLNEGNLNRDIWRMMVQNLIKDARFNSFEKASYAALAGYISPILPVCRTYMDFVWVYLKALYEHILDKEIKQNMSTLREFTNFEHENNEDYIFINLIKTSMCSSLNNLMKIFDRIELLINSKGAGSNLTVNNSDVENPYSVVLKYVILAGVDGFKSNTNEILEYLKSKIEFNRNNGHLLRFSTHLALFFKAASFELKNETFIEINEKYVNYLVENNCKEIIAYYLSQMPNELQIKHYSKFLQSISDNKERQNLLKLAKERNMNVQAITSTIVDNLSQKSININTQQQLNQSTTAIMSKMTKQSLTEEDKVKINAIDWIIYDSTQRFKLLEFANLTMRYFLLERQNFEATEATFIKIPHDTLACIMQQYNFNSSNQTSNVEDHLQLMIDNLPLNVTNSIKEFIGFKEYIETINIYNDWFEFFHRERPIKPQPKYDLNTTQMNHQDQSNLFAERISYDYQLKQYEDLLNRWNSKAKAISDKVRNKFLTLLKFPFGGWMVDINENDSDYISDDDEEDNSNDKQSSDTEMIDDSTTHQSYSKSKQIDETKQRLVQMKSIRRLYLPNLCFVLIDMLNKMKLNKELITISHVVASEHYKLYNLFDQKQLRCFLNKIADASICLLDDNLDFLGYSNS